MEAEYEPMAGEDGGEERGEGRGSGEVSRRLKRGGVLVGAFLVCAALILTIILPLRCGVAFALGE